jgi:hypothetical protein
MITQKRLHDLFEYREDGNLIRKISVTSNARVGDIAGSPNDRGYWLVNIDHKRCSVHRLIFLYHHGYLTPGMDIDHIDGNPGNNRIENLREVTHTQNIQNSKINSKNTSGVKGVYWDKQRSKWRTGIKVEGKKTDLGSYNTIEEAEAVVREAREKYHGEYARHK